MGRHRATAAVGLLSLLALLQLPAGADPGDLDTSFGNGGSKLVHLGGYEEAAKVARIGDKIVQVGRSRIGPPGTPFDWGIVRYKQNGQLDKSFSGDGRKRIDFGENDDARAVAPAGSGKIWVAGYAGAHMALIRLKPNGALDKSFAKKGVKLIRLGSGSYAEDIVVLGDGSVILAGGICSSDCSFALAKVKPNGALDKKFGNRRGRTVTHVGTGDDGSVAAAKVGKRIVVVGYARSAVPMDDYDTAIVKYGMGGKLDRKFGDKGKRLLDFAPGNGDYATGAVSAGGGEFVILSSVGEGVNRDLGLAKLNPGGALDPTFRGGGMFVDDFGGTDNALDLVRQGKKLLVGATSNGAAAIRFLANGNRDAGFGTDGRANLPGVNGNSVVVVKSRIVVGGHDVGPSTDFDFAVVGFRKG